MGSTFWSLWHSDTHAVQAQFGGPVLKASGRVQYTSFQLGFKSPMTTDQHTAGGSVSQLGPSTIAKNTALARGRCAKQPEVGTDMPWLLTVDCIAYSDILNTFNPTYLHSILSIAIKETPECQHCIVWQWAAFWAWGNGKFPNRNKENLT